VTEVVGRLEATVSQGNKSARRWRPANIVIALASTLILIIFAIFAFLCWQAYGTVLEAGRLKAQTAANIVSDDIAWAVGASRASLKLVAAKAGDDPSALSEDDKKELDAALADLPASATLAIYDASGNAVPAADSANLPKSIAAEDFFRAVQQGTDWIVAPQGKDERTGAAAVVIAQRLGKAAFAGVAVIALPGSLMRSFWKPQNLGPNSVVSVFREDGWLVARYPPLEQTIDASKTSANWQTISSAASGSFTAVSPRDGITRIVAFEHLPHAGLVVLASVSQDAILGGLWNSITIVTWLLAPIALPLLIGAIWTARILRRSERTQANLTAALEHNEILFREIHHRVKNNLQSVSSLLQMQPIPREIKADMGQRIAAMSAVHEHIYRSSDFEQVRVRDYLQTLVENIRAGANSRAELVLDLEDLAVDKDAATPLGLIVNEVVANAFKHAFSDGRTGVITIRLASANGQGELTVEDNGVGFDPEAPAKGIGRRLIGALTAQLNGKSSFSAAPGGGAKFVLKFPLGKAG
jgi:two-component sensor histidine kinase